MNILRLLFSGFALFLITSCSKLPSESDARKLFDESSNTNGLITLLSFKKTDGVERNFMGQEFYEMRFEAEFDILNDCVCSLRSQGRGISAEPIGPGYLGLLFSGQFEARKGQRRKIESTMIFKKTENGWGLK